MPLFESKPKLSIEECCRQFYDSTIFHAIIAGVDGWSAYLDTAFNYIAEVDQSFLSVNPTLFRKDMTALRMELFAFALGCSNKFGKEKYTIPQSLFTKRYLEENENLEIWDIMGEYNQVIAMSATMNANGEQYSGRIGRAVITRINLLKSNAAEDWMEANIVNTDAMTQEEEDKLTCAIRVFNRIGADTKREDDVVVKLLASRCASRLNCNVNMKYEALFRLATTIFGFYKGAEDYLKSVDLRG
jgi:hypothetical protein